jgi:phosphoribosylformylglycinamidine synthase
MSTVKALVLTGYGLNCDYETAFAFEQAGAAADRVHINALIEGGVRLDDYQIMAFIGGFSWGDDHGAGVVQAVRMKTRMGDKILAFIENDKMVLGICNGFQALVNLGLLPAFDGDYTNRLVALTHNDCGNFRDQWVHLAINPASPCIFTNGIERAEFPVRHGEGKFVADSDVIERLVAGNQVVMRYAGADGAAAGGCFPDNPNGSLTDIAGICDPSGRVFGLMPHPEAYNHLTSHPDWTRQKQIISREGQSFSLEEPVGIRIFRNAVDHMRGS